MSRSPVRSRFTPRLATGSAERTGTPPAIRRGSGGTTGQGMIAQGMIAQGMIGQGMIGQGMIGQGMIGRPCH